MSWLPVVRSLRTESVIAVGCLAWLVPSLIQASDGAHGSFVAQEIVVDTVAGRPVVTTEFPRRGGDPGAWRLVEELRLGNVMGDGPQGFGDIHDIAVDQAGRIYVLDFASKEVRVFGRDGAYLRAMAREGEGPGETRYRGGPARRITWRPPAQLWISGGQQYLVVDTLGNELHRTAGRPRPGMFLPGEVPRSSSVIAAGTDGSLFSVVDVIAMRSPTVVGVLHHTYVVRSPVSVDHEMLHGDTLAIEIRNLVEISPRAARGASAISVRHVEADAPRFVWTVGHDDATLWLAHRARYRFDKLTFAGDTVLAFQMGDVHPMPPPEDSEEFVPVLAALASSPEGWLWVQREEPETEGGSTWDVLDNCGRYRATVSAPVGLRRVEVGAGGELHGISSDDLGIDFVHRFRLQSEVGTPIAAEVCPF